MFSRIKAVAKKEAKHLLRDSRMLFVILFFPVFLLVMFGYAINLDVKHIKFAVLDNDNGRFSRDFLRALNSGEYFQKPVYLSSDSEIKRMLDEEFVQAVIVFPVDFSKELEKPQGTSNIQILVDGVNGNTASIIKNYLEAAVFKFNEQILNTRLSSIGLTFKPAPNLEPRFWFNPNLESTHFLLPGLIAMILIVSSVITVSLSLVREKERGTIEQIKVSSITTIELMLGKAFPYIILAIIDAVFILTAGYLLFDIVVMGNYFLLFVSILIFIFSSTSLGIFISVVADTQQVAFTAATFATLLPSVILSGFVFPIESMPVIIQVITNITPAKFFIVVLRAIILKGVGLSAIWDQLIYLLLFTLAFLALASKINQRKEAL